MREAAIDFCKRSRLITKKTTITTAVGTSAYSLSITDLTPFRIEYIRRDTNFLDASSEAEFESESFDTNSGEASHYYLDADNQIVLGNIPDAVETLTVKASVRPADDATSVPDALYIDWRNGIAAGARAWLRENYDEWNNENEQTKDAMIFSGSIDDAASRRDRSGTRKPRRIRGHYF